MANIRDLLEKIKTAIRGKEVRGAIHDSIEQCYEDASESVAKSTEALELATEISERMDDIGDVRSLIAKVENTSTAAYLHLAGEYIIFNNAIYQTRGMIYPGDTITPGTNIGSLPYDGGMAKALSLAIEPLQFTVRYNGLQTISDSEKRFARKNIDAVGSSDLDEVSRFVANGSETIDLSDYERSATPSSFNGVLPFTIGPLGTVIKVGTTSYKSYQIERKTGRTVLKITANSTKTAMVTFVNEPLPNTLTNGTDVSSYVCSGSEAQYSILAGETEYIPIPSDCAYFIIRRNFGSTSPEWAPEWVSMTTGIDERVSVLEPAASSEDVGKFLKAKTVADGKVTEYEFGDGSAEDVAELKSATTAADRISANSIDGAMSELSGKTVYTPDTFGHYYTAATTQIYANMAERLTPSAGYSCMLIEVTPGEAYHIHTHGFGGTNRGWIKCAADGTRTDYSRRTSGVEDRVIPIEQGEKYLAINNRTESGTECWAIKLKNDGRFDFVGKNVAIIGDSINTNGDYIKNGVVNPLGNVPEIVIMQEDVGATLSAYVTTYDIGTELHGSVTIDGTTTTGHTIAAEDVGKEITFVPVQADVTEPPTIIGKPLTYNQESRKVWWEHAMDVYGFNPIPVCWSGSSVSSHEGGTSYAWHESTIRKCGIRTPGSMTRTAPDLIIVSRGANDFTHSPYAKVEEDYLFSTMHGYPDTDEYLEEGNTKYSFPRACALLVKRLRTAYPNTQIVFCTIDYLQRIVDSYPTRTGNTGSTYLMWNQCIRNVANAFGCHLIEFDKDGLTFENIANYTVDTNGTHVHPNDAGHKIMGNRAIIDLKKINGIV